VKKRKILRKHGSIVCMGKTAATGLLKLFVNGKERCHTTDDPSA